MGTKQDKWVIIFLIYADFIKSDTPESPQFDTAYAKELDKLLERLYKTKFDKSNIKIYIIYGSLNYKKTSDDSEAQKLHSDVHIFQLQSKIYGNNMVHLKIIENGEIPERSENDLGTFSLQRKKSLKKTFNYIKGLNKGDNKVKYILNTWDHGSVFGIFKSEIHIRVVRGFPEITKEEYPNLFFLIKKIPRLNANIPPLDKSVVVFEKDNFLNKINLGNIISIDKFKELIHNKILVFETNDSGEMIKLNHPNLLKKFDSEEEFINWLEILEYFPISADKTSFLNAMLSFNIQPAGILEILTNEELSGAIEESFGKIELISMMNCWMMNLHSLYAFRNCVEYLIAPQGGISEPGYDYKSIIELINKPKINTNKIIKKYISSSYNFKNKERKNKKTEINSWAIMAATVFKNKDIINDSLVKEIESIAQILVEELESKTNTKEEEREILRKLSFVHFMAKISYNFSYGERYFQLDLLNWLQTLDGFNPVQEDFPILKNFEKEHVVRVQKLSSQLFLRNARYLNHVYDFQVENNTGSPFRGVTIYKPNGLSIYLPFVNNKNSIADKLYIIKSATEKLADRIPTWTKLINKLSL